MPNHHRRVVPLHGLCPSCRGSHDRLMPVGAAPDGSCAREYLVCDPCGTVWLSPSPRPLADPPGPEETAENLMELAQLEEVVPLFEPVEVEERCYENRDAVADPSQLAGSREADDGELMTCALTPADCADRGLEEPFEEAVDFLRRVYRQQQGDSEPSADGGTFYLTLSVEPPA